MQGSNASLQQPSPPVISQRWWPRSTCFAPPQVKLDWSPDPSLTVVLAAKGYPGSYAKGGAINNLQGVEGAKVFHAGTALKDGQVVSAGEGRQLSWKSAGCPGIHHVRIKCLSVPTTPPHPAGGRVLGVTATGSDVLQAQQKAYAAVDQIDFADGFCRRDIGWRAVARLREQQRA